MTLLQIKYFSVLAECLSFRKASELLYITQPNLSMQISSLEEELGIQLFERKYGSVELTPGGKIMYDAVQRTNKYLTDTLEKARYSMRSKRISITIGIPERARMGNLHAILSAFQASHPNIVIHSESCPLSGVLLSSPNGKYDLVINQRFVLQNENELEITPLAIKHSAVVISKSHPLIKDIAQPTLKDLRHCPFIHYIPSSDDPNRLIEHVKYNWAQEGLSVQEIILVPNVDSALWAAATHVGVASLDDTIILPDDLDLICLPSDLPICLVIARRKDNEIECLDELIRMIKENLDLNYS